MAPDWMSTSARSQFQRQTEGYLKILRAIADLDMFWIESTASIPKRRLCPASKSAPDLVLPRRCLGLRAISALFPRAGDGCRDHRHTLERVWQSMKIARQREAHEVNVARINFTATSAP